MKYEYVKKTHRLNVIFNEIKTHKLIKKTYLAEILGVSEKTIARDIIELIDRGYKIQRVKGRCGGYSLSKEE